MEIKQFEKWHFDVALRSAGSYMSLLNINVDYLAKTLQFQLEIPYDPRKDTFKHRFLISFSNFVSLRVSNLFGSYTIDAILFDLLKQFNLHDSNPGVFRLKGSDYIKWLVDTDICGNYSMEAQDLTHYLFITNSQILDVIVENEDTPTIQKLLVPINSISIG